MGFMVNQHLAPAIWKNHQKKFECTKLYHAEMIKIRKAHDAERRVMWVQRRILDCNTASDNTDKNEVSH